MKYARYALTALLAVSFGVAATAPDGLDEAKWEKAKKEYIRMLSHENAGVKASAAGYIRKYNITEATEALRGVLECENCEVVKVSAALALIEIAGDDGLNIIREVMENEESDLVISFYKAILHSDAEKISAPISAN